jgi:hypothetical protein
MATWNELIGYVRTKYSVADEKADMVKLIFQVGDGRTQVVLLWFQTLDGGHEQWVQIESPFGEINKVNLGAAIEAAGQTVCGGLASFGPLVTFRHSVPLENLDINEFERPLALVTSTADQLEQRFTGGDQF